MERLTKRLSSGAPNKQDSIPHPRGSGIGIGGDEGCLS